MRPSVGEFNPYFDRYISLVAGDRVVPMLQAQQDQARALFGGLGDTAAGGRYAPDKWSVREVLGHIIDAERVFGFRAFWFARGGVGALPAFEQEPFMVAAHHDETPIGELLDEFLALRSSHILMLEHLAPADWMAAGIASAHPMSVRAAAFMTAGHFEYHRRILVERYGLAG